VCPLRQPAHTTLTIIARFSLDEPHRQLFYPPFLNTCSMYCGIFLVVHFAINNRSQLEAIVVLAPEVKHQDSLFQMSCCSSWFIQVAPFISITSQNRENIVLCYGVGNFKYAVLCRGTCKNPSQCQACYAMLCMLDLHPPVQHLQQFCYQYCQISCL